MTYSSSLAMSRQRFTTTRSSNTVKYRDSRARTLGPVSNTVILIVLACLLGLLYLTQVTKTNAFGYKIDALTKQQTQLKSEHDNLELAAASMQSLDRTAASSQAKSLTPVTPSGTVAN